MTRQSHTAPARPTWFSRVEKASGAIPIRVAKARFPVQTHTVRDSRSGVPALLRVARANGHPVHDPSPDHTTRAVPRCSVPPRRRNGADSSLSATLADSTEDLRGRLPSIPVRIIVERLPKAQIESVLLRFCRQLLKRFDRHHHQRRTPVVSEHTWPMRIRQLLGMTPGVSREIGQSDNLRL